VFAFFPPVTLVVSFIQPASAASWFVTGNWFWFVTGNSKVTGNEPAAL
jgi:hypothetical protein